MKITHIYAENYKTYRNLDLDLTVSNERPIILVGGGNGCGKTTLFDAIYHALYGLDIKTSKEFTELFNSGALLEQGIDEKSIVLEISFNGQVLGQTVPYKLKRTYKYIDGKVRWNVELNMNGNKFVYGIATPASTRDANEQTVNKIIAANLPSELSNYFLFDAMKTSELVKEEQINKLIMKNINSVMGFNKYAKLKATSEVLLDQKKSSKLENEAQRAEFESLSQQKKDKENKLTQIKEDYANAITFSTDHKEQYENLKTGRSSDEMTRDKMKQKENEIKRVYDESSKYYKDMEALMKDLEINVLYPKLAAEIRNEVEQIVHEKENVAREKGEQFTDEQIEIIVKEALNNLSVQYPELLAIDVKALTQKIQASRNKGVSFVEKYFNLTDEDVEILDKHTHTTYANQFPALDNKRENLVADIKDLPEKTRQLESYKRAISGNDYSFITTYEENENNIKSLQQAKNSLMRDISELSAKIAKYDYDIPQIPDPQYDMLCKLPNFFKTLSSRLLAEKRKNIEDMMKEQLNVNLVAYAGVIGRVSLEGATSDDINFKIYHKNGNEIYLSQLNAGAKQTLMQVLLKVLYELGDYNPPVMIDTVMGVLDKESREVILENYFPNLAEQTILLSTDTEITVERDFKKLAPFIAKTYTLHRDKEAQCTTISEDYFGLTSNED